MAKRAGYFPRIPDEELVLAALLGDLEAFDELVRRFRGGVVAVAEQVLGHREAARDVAQEAFLLAFKALPQLEEPENFAGWLCAIARPSRAAGRRAGRAQPAGRTVGAGPAAPRAERRTRRPPGGGGRARVRPRRGPRRPGRTAAGPPGGPPPPLLRGVAGATDRRLPVAAGHHGQVAPAPGPRTDAPRTAGARRRAA